MGIKFKNCIAYTNKQHNYSRERVLHPNYNVDYDPEMLEHEDNNAVYHVTKLSNLRNILKHGLIPQIGNNAKHCNENTKAVYLFPNVESVNTALSNWFGDLYNDDEILVCLKISKQNLQLVPSTVDYELLSTQVIKPENIISANLQ